MILRVFRFSYKYLLKNVAVLLFCFGVYYSCYAKEKHAHEASEKLIVNSEELILNKTDNTSHFIGNVVATMGNVILRSEKIIVYYKNVQGKKSIEKIHIPTKIIITRSGQDEIVTADNGEYSAKTNSILLLGNVIIQQKKDLIITNKFIYFLDDKNKKN